jgi:hypothetical protein
LTLKGLNLFHGYLGAKLLLNTEKAKYERKAKKEKEKHSYPRTMITAR